MRGTPSLPCGSGRPRASRGRVLRGRPDSSRSRSAMCPSWLTCHSCYTDWHERTCRPDPLDGRDRSGGPGRVWRGVAERAARGCDRTHRTHRSHSQRGCDPLVRPRPRDRRKRRSSRRPVPRRAVPHQGPLRHICGAADQQWQRRVQGGARRRRRRHDTRQPLSRGRARDRRPHEQPRARQRADHRARRVGRDPQPVGHDAYARWVKRGCGRRRRVGDGAVRPRQ